MQALPTKDGRDGENLVHFIMCVSSMVYITPGGELIDLMRVDLMRVDLVRIDLVAIDLVSRGN